MSTAGQQGRRAERTAQQAAESGPIKALGRVGLIAYGVIHLLVAYLAVPAALLCSSVCSRSARTGCLPGSIPRRPGINVNS